MHCYSELDIQTGAISLRDRCLSTYKKMYNHHEENTTLEWVDAAGGMPLFSYLKWLMHGTDHNFTCLQGETNRINNISVVTEWLNNNIENQDYVYYFNIIMLPSDEYATLFTIQFPEFRIVKKTINSINGTSSSLC